MSMVRGLQATAQGGFLSLSKVQPLLVAAKKSRWCLSTSVQGMMLLNAATNCIQLTAGALRMLEIDERFNLRSMRVGGKRGIKLAKLDSMAQYCAAPRLICCGS